MLYFAQCVSTKQTDLLLDHCLPKGNLLCQAKQKHLKRIAGKRHSKGRQSRMEKCNLHEMFTNFKPFSSFRVAENSS